MKDVAILLATVGLLLSLFDLWGSSRDTVGSGAAERGGHAAVELPATSELHAGPVSFTSSVTF